MKDFGQRSLPSQLCITPHNQELKAECVFCKQFLHPLAPRSLSSISNVLSSPLPRKATLVRYKGVLISGKTFIQGNQICGNSTHLPSERSFTKLNKTSLFIIVVIVLQLHNIKKNLRGLVQTKELSVPNTFPCFCDTKKLLAALKWLCL